ARVVAECDARGVILGMTNRSLPGLNNTICLSPALTVTAEEIDQIAEVLDQALAVVGGLAAETAA
ncbi:MAG: hypothetical protein VX878_09380, partial [Pseudomonadota bacterium]|nr:hypothetical protein [Pseudomonadota bacterium]